MDGLIYGRVGMREKEGSGVASPAILPRSEIPPTWVLREVLAARRAGTNEAVDATVVFSANHDTRYERRTESDPNR